MTTTNPARAERSALADLLERVGPQAPTLCEGWLTRDLAAHLVLRERRPDAALGIKVSRLASRTGDIQENLASGPWDALVGQLRSGPPRWSPLGIGPLDKAANTAEFFVHHEDVRRGQASWEPRSLDAELEAGLWSTLKLAGRRSFRASPVGVVLRRPDGLTITAKEATPVVTVVGPVGELVLHAFGRAAARVAFEGDPEAVRRLAETPRRP